MPLFEEALTASDIVHGKGSFATDPLLLERETFSGETAAAHRTEALDISDAGRLPGM